MKSVSAAMQTHLDSGMTTLSHCIKITRTDGEVYGFTDHDKDLSVDGVTYQTLLSADVSAVETQSGLNVDTLEMSGYLYAMGASEANISAGLWDFADIRVFLVNWADTSMQIKLRRGWLGEISYTRDFKAELRGVAQKLQQVIIELVSETCKADLFDERCKVVEVEGSNKFTGCVVTTVISSQREFSSATGSPSIANAANDYFTNGKIEWTKGDNLGLLMEVKLHTVGSPNGAIISLVHAMPYAIQVGDEFTIWAGCQKRYTEDCGTKFDNQDNFRGFPHLPGLDQILKGPDR